MGNRGAGYGAGISWSSGMLFIPGIGIKAALATTLTYAATSGIKGSFGALIGAGVNEWRQQNGITFGF